MSERINTPFTNEHFADWCLKMAEKKSPYWYGTCVYKASNSVLSSKSRQYPDHYGSSRTARYKKDIANKQVVSDCVGGCKGYAWTNGGQGVLESIGTDQKYTSKYGSNGCPDKSASGMFSYCKSKDMDWGTIDTLPEIMGLALFTDGHIGYYVGGGYAVEWRGFNYGCVKTVVKERTWKHWAKLPFINYGDTGDAQPAETVTYIVGFRVFRFRVILIVLFIYFDIYPLPDTLLLFLMSHPSSHPLHPNLRRIHRREASASLRMEGSRYHADHVGNRTPA